MNSSLLNTVNRDLDIKNLLFSFLKPPHISLAALFFILFLSWKSMQFKPTLSDWTHREIQREIQKVIQSHIEGRFPFSQNIQFNKIWTEKVKESAIKVSFSLSFDDRNNSESSLVEIEGSTILRKNEVSLKKDEEIWNFDQLNILKNWVQFKEGLKIQASK